MEIRFLGPQAAAGDFVPLAGTSDRRFTQGQNGVERVLATRDGKVEFVFLAD